jgi:hypothetical protein
MKVAQYRAGASGPIIIASQLTGDVGEKYSGWTRLTEYAEIDFVRLPTDAEVKSQLDELRMKLQETLNELAEARAQLLSLTHETQS